MQTDRSIGQRLWSGLVRLVSTAFILGLAGLVAYLAAERNARTYALAVEKDNLVVQKGRMWPWGSEEFKPADPALADAYAPIPLEGLPIETSLQQQQFGDRDELDRAMYGVLDRLARPRISSDDPKEVDRGVYYVRRMQKLSGLTAEQRTSVEKLQGEFAWYLARYKLDQARQLLSEALSQLEVASTGPSKNAQRANVMAAEIAQPARQFEETLRRVLGGLPVAPPTPTPATSAPAPGGTGNGAQAPAAPSSGTEKSGEAMAPVPGSSPANAGQ